jgi:hypothetical protein
VYTTAAVGKLSAIDTEQYAEQFCSMDFFCASKMKTLKMNNVAMCCIAQKGIGTSTVSKKSTAS